MATAQIPTVPSAIKKCVTVDNVQTCTEKVTLEYVIRDESLAAEEHPVVTLSRHHNKGDWKSLQGLLSEVLRTISCNKDYFDLPSGSSCGEGNPRLGFDLTRDFVWVIWVGEDFAGKRTIYRVLAHDGLAPFSSALPGLAEKSSSVVYEVFLSDVAAADHNSLYTFSRQPDPREGQLADFVKQATGPLFAVGAKVIGSVAVRPAGVDMAVQPPKILRTTLTSTLGTLTPPIERAKGKVADVASQPARLEGLLEDAELLASRLKFVEARNSSCAKKLVDILFPSLITSASKDECLSATSTPQSCRDLIDEEFRRLTKATDDECAGLVASAVNAENAARPVGERLPAADVAKEIEKRLTQERQVMQTVDAKFREALATKQPERLTAEGTFANTPKTHWNFGALTSLIVSARTKEARVKVGNDGKIAADPLGRQMNLVVVNFAPWGYDPEAQEIAWSERIRPFVGAVISPEFGVATGVSVLIWRGVGVNGGVALLGIPTTSGDDKIGEVPSDTNDPYGLKAGTAYFVGVSYNFK